MGLTSCLTRCAYEKAIAAQEGLYLEAVSEEHNFYLRAYHMALT